MKSKSNFLLFFVRLLCFFICFVLSFSIEAVFADSSSDKKMECLCPADAVNLKKQFGESFKEFEHAFNECDAETSAQCSNPSQHCTVQHTIPALTARGPYQGPADEAERFLSRLAVSDSAIVQESKQVFRGVGCVWKEVEQKSTRMTGDLEPDSEFAPPVQCKGGCNIEDLSRFERIMPGSRCPKYVENGDVCNAYRCIIALVYKGKVREVRQAPCQ